MSDKINLKRKSGDVLDEDVFLNRLGKIIKRDFYPELQKIQHFKKMFVYSNLVTMFKKMI